MYKALSLLLLTFSSTAFASGFFHWGSKDLHARTEKRHFKEQNKRKQSATGQKRFMVIQKATKAHIQRDPNNENVLLITFDNVDPYIAYYKVEPNRNYGILTMKQFMWYCNMGKSMFSKDNPRGAMGYLSFEFQSEEGKKLEFNVFQLNKPKYNKKANQLTYQIESLPGFELKDHDVINVILTIDLSLK